MLPPFNLQQVDLIVSLSQRAAEEASSKCQKQLPHLYNQRRTLLANRKKRLAFEARQKDELRKLYRSLGLVQPVEDQITNSGTCWD